MRLGVHWWTSGLLPGAQGALVVAGGGGREGPGATSPGGSQECAWTQQDRAALHLLGLRISVPNLQPR